MFVRPHRVAAMLAVPLLLKILTGGFSFLLPFPVFLPLHFDQV